jgi:PBSX family phage terminase large subunit
VTEIPFVYEAFPVHVPFHMTRAREKAAIGAVGSGKTLALCADAIGLALSQPGSRIMVARQTIPALRDTTETEFVNLLTQRREDEESGQTLWDLCDAKRQAGHIDRIYFPNGSEVLFRSLDDWRKHMSLNLAAVYIDEASEAEVDAYNGLKTRLRQQQPTAAARELGYKWDRENVRQHIALATNPNGHDWIWQYFVHEQNPERRYFRSTSFDNPTLYQDNGEPSPYLRSLLQMPEIWVRRYVLCEFDAFEGQILEFSPMDHVVSHFDPPADWERAMGLDWGLRNPTAVVWWARKPGSSRWVQYREWQTYDPLDVVSRESYQTMSVHDVAHKIKMLEAGETIKYRAADPAIRQRMGESVKSVEYWFSTHGLHFQMGSKDYSTRINALNQMLVAGELVLTDQCQMTSVAFQQYRWASIQVSRNDVDGAERPRKKDDHLVDATQYLATLFYSTKLPEPVPEKDFSLNGEIWDQVKSQVKRQRRLNRYNTVQ